MARFPCSRCGQRYRGPQRSAYPALVDGITQSRSKARLCPTHAAELLAYCEASLLEQTDDVLAQAPLYPACCNCGSEISGRSPAVFVTSYLDGGERSFWGQLHDVCAPSVAGILGVPPLEAT